MWQVEGFHDGIWLLTERERAEADTFESDPLPPFAAASRVAEWFPEGPTEPPSWVLSDACADLGAPSTPDRGPAAPLLRDLLRAALLDGRLTAVRVKQRMPPGDTPSSAPEPPPPPPPAKQDEKTWVEIVLRTRDDDQPIPFKRYRIELPDGSVRQGMLDSNGAARVSGIDPGTCKVTFPDLHETEWT